MKNVVNAPYMIALLKLDQWQNRGDIEVQLLNQNIIEYYYRFIRTKRDEQDIAEYMEVLKKRTVKEVK